MKTFTLFVLVFMIIIKITSGDINCHEKDSNAEWYLSFNGSDTLTCGQNVSSACRTLNWLLERFHNTSYNKNRTLFLVTDIDLTIDNVLLNKHPWMYNLSAVTCMVTADRICAMTLNEVTLGNSIWILVGFNLTIINAIVPKTKFLLNSNYQDDIIHSVKILSTSFGQLKASGGFNINISNCYIDGSTRLTSTLIDIVNCNLSITNLIFFNQMKHDKGPAIINAIKCTIDMTNINILHNYALDGLIMASNNSKLQIQNSMFSGNGLLFLTKSVLILNHNSVLFLSNCKCENNRALHGACVLASGNVKINARKSIFTDNHAIIGGAIYWKSNVIVDRTSEISRKKFENPRQGRIILDYKSELVFEKCIFTGHFAFRGGVFYVNGSTNVSMNNCIIKSNGGLMDSTILVHGQHSSSTKFKIKGCFFTDDISWGAGILSIRQAHLDIHNSTVSGSALSLISVSHYSVVNITNLSIQHSPTPFAYVSIQNNVKLYLADSSIKSSYLAFYPNGFFLYARNNCSVIISHSQFGDGDQNRIMTNVFGLRSFSSLETRNCTFENSNHSYSRLLTAYDNSKAMFTECLFVKTNGFEVTHNSELHIKSSRLIESTYTVQNYALMEITENSHMSISNSTFMNNVLQNDKLIFVASESSLTIYDCLYTGNDMSTHVTGSGSNITIKNTRFCTNYVRKSSREPGGLLVINGTLVAVVHSSFKNNYIYGGITSLMTLSANTILIQKCLVSKNVLNVGLSVFQVNPFILIEASKFISVMDTKMDKNCIYFEHQGIYQAILRVSSAKRIPGSYLSIENCTFEMNEMTYAYIKGISDVFVRHSTFHLPDRDYGDYSNIFVTGIKTLRLWNSVFYDRQKEIELFFEYDFSYPNEINFLTLNTNFTLRRKTLETKDVHFLQIAESKDLIYTSPFVQLHHEETSYAATVPVKCLQSDDYPCFCYYDMDTRVNVYNCSSANMDTLPSSVPNLTNWVILENNQIKNIDGYRPYYSRVQFLHLGENILSSINESFLVQLEQYRSITWLNLTKNMLTSIPSQIQELHHLNKLWLSGNPFHCDCSMLWMIGFLNNFTTSSGEHIVEDYQDVTCHSGTAIGMPIYKLNEVILGCYPKGLTIWQKVLIGTGSGTAGIIIILLFFIILKRSRTVQFFIYYRLKIKSVLRIKRDQDDENIEEKEYDGFLSYSNKDTDWVSQVLRKNKRTKGSKRFDLESNYGFKLVVPQRDFKPGTDRSEKIANGLQKSRRIIFIISKNFLRSPQRLHQFQLADAEALKKKKNYIIIVFKEKLEANELTPKILTYKTLGLCIECFDNFEEIAAKIRFNMPKTPLRQLKPELFPDSEDEEYAFDSDNLDTDS